MRTKQDPRRSAAARDLPANVSVNDFKIPRETRIRHNALWDAAREAYERYVLAHRHSGALEWLAYEAWLETQIRGPHPGWLPVRAMKHRYSQLDFTFKSALVREPDGAL